MDRLADLAYVHADACLAVVTACAVTGLLVVVASRWSRP